MNISLILINQEYEYNKPQHTSDVEEEEEEEEYTKDEDTEDLTTSTLPSIACEAVGNYTALVSHYNNSYPPSNFPVINRVVY